MAFQILANSNSNLTSTNIVENRITSRRDEYKKFDGTSATVDEYVTCAAKTGTGIFTLKDHSTGTFGTTGATAVNGSGVSFTGQASLTVLDSFTVTTTSGNNLFLNYAHTSGTQSLAGCLYEVQAAH